MSHTLNEYNKGDVVNVELGATSHRPGIVLSDGVQVHNSRYLVLVGLEKIECVVLAGTFIPCGTAPSPPRPSSLVGKRFA